MGRFVFYRLMWIPATLLAISMVSFAMISLPPGDYVDRYADQLAVDGQTMTQAEKQDMRHRYGLDLPVPQQYLHWVKNIILHGDFGYSFALQRPVSTVIWERLGLTTILSLVTLFTTWVIAIPIGIYVAVNKYSLTDYVFTLFGFIGLALPNFLLALGLMYMIYAYTGESVGGLFSARYADAPWSFAKLLDLASHLWIPVMVLAMSGMASIIRTTRANLLDEMHQPYVVTARAKGVGEFALLMKYPVRHAMNPFVSGLHDVFSHIISGETIVAIVLGLQTTGPLLLESLRGQDMFLAATLIMFLGVLGMMGTLFSDILLAWLDPRIRRQFEAGGSANGRAGGRK